MVLAVVVVGLVAAQFWRVLGVEGKAREVEVERAKIAVEQLLRDAVGNPQVFALVPAEKQVEIRRQGGRLEPVVEPEVGWLCEDQDTTLDFVVADRLDRAARAEFVAADAAAAQQEYDACLAGSPRAVDRLAVLSAAMWQAQRAEAHERRNLLLQQGEQVAGELPPASGGVPFVANAIAGAVRLRALVGGPPPAWWRTVLPRLLPAARDSCLAAVAGSDGKDELQALCAKVDARRRELAAVAGLLGEGPLAGAGMAAPRSPQQMAWWQPGPRGGWLATAMSVPEWLALVQRAGERGIAPQWPWLLEPRVLDRWQDTSAAGTSLAGIPGLCELRPIDRPLLDQGSLMLPIATLVLLLAFVLLLTQQFRAARREAAAARKQTEFLTTVTHELKTPLASIRLLSELLAAGRVRGKETEYYGLLAVEAGRLGMLIENVLDLGRAERGERAFDLRSLDLGDVVRETLAMMAPLCERDGLHVALHEDVASATVHGDRSALVQALLNVLDNARKYAASGQRLEVTVQNGTPAQYAVRIRDHGPGVPEGEREAIFDRFARGRAQQHGSIAGVGIGLYLARSIARRHGGDLVCEAPREGKGAQFVLTLPQEDAS